MKRRRLALSHVKWTDEMKKETEIILTKEFTLPEKDGPDATRFRVPFAWESSKLSKRKLELNRVYTTEILKPIQKLRLGTVIDHLSEQCDVPLPVGAPSWVISKKFR